MVRSVFWSCCIVRSRTVIELINIAIRTFRRNFVRVFREPRHVCKFSLIYRNLSLFRFSYSMISVNFINIQLWTAVYSRIPQIIFTEGFQHSKRLVNFSCRTKLTSHLNCYLERWIEWQKFIAQIWYRHLNFKHHVVQLNESCLYTKGIE